MTFGGEAMTEYEDWKKRFQELRERIPVDTLAPGQSDDDVEFTIIRDPDTQQEFAIPKKNFRKRQQERWDRMCSAHPGLPPLMGLGRLSEYQRKIYDELVAGFKNGILFGQAGTGKTQVALLALHNLCMGARSVLALRFTEIKRRMEVRQTEADGTTPLQVLATFTSPEYLLIDEVGYGQSERKTVSEHERQIIFDIVSERDAFDKNTWITTNMNLTMLEDIYGDATISRLGKWDGCVKADFSQQPNYRYRRIQ